MAGEMGIAAGITAGLQQVNQGMINAENIAQSREQRRREAEKHAIYLQSSATQQQAANVQLETMQLQLDQMQKAKAKEDMFNALHAFEDTGDAKYLNLVKDKNPMIKDLFDKAGTVSTSSIKDYSLEKLKEMGYDENKYLKPVVITKADGTQSLMDMTGFYASSGFLKEMRQDKLDALTLKAKENEAKLMEASLPGETAKANLATAMVTHLTDQVNSGRLTPEQAWRKMVDANTPTRQSAGESATIPTDVKSATYFGKLKNKIDSGSASAEEQAIYEAHLTDKGGSAAANETKINNDIRDLAKTNIDVTKPDFDLSKVPDEQKGKVNSLTRQLERTQSGKALVSNIAGIMEKDLGAVNSTATKLSSMALEENVTTAMVKEQINQVKAYLPESFATMSDADLKDAKFRQAYLSVSATFLKIQSGLTVSDKEVARFAESMGTLNKNTKVNMIGLKTKLDEVIGSYEANSYLEPTLYNIKYKKGIQQMQQVSKNLNGYINGSGTAGPTTQSNKKTLHKIFGTGAM